MNQPYESADYLKRWKWLVPIWLRSQMRSVMHRRRLGRRKHILASEAGKLVSQGELSG